MTAEARLLASVVVLAVASGCSLNNFHEVDPGKFYRSAQLDGDELRELIPEHGIRTVVNLRGANLDKEWYREEVAACAELVVTHLDHSMSARRIPHREELLGLLEILDEAERPILVHCQGGADRSGLASALYAIEHMGMTKEAAAAQLSIGYWHLAWWTPSPHYFLEIYQGKDWARAVYDPMRQDYLHYESR